jgi:hypothetical protein
MIIEYRDQVAWIAASDPSEDERQVLAQFTEALPDIPKTIRVNNVCEYVKIAEGKFENADTRTLDCYWVDYHFNVQGESQLPKEGA